MVIGQEWYQSGKPVLWTQRSGKATLLRGETIIGEGTYQFDGGRYESPPSGRCKVQIEPSVGMYRQNPKEPLILKIEEGATFQLVGRTTRRIEHVYSTVTMLDFRGVEVQSKKHLHDILHFEFEASIPHGAPRSPAADPGHSPAVRDGAAPAVGERLQWRGANGRLVPIDVPS